MLKAWKWYQKCLAKHPVKTQAISSGFIWGLGDIAAQTATANRLRTQTHDEDKRVEINWKRVATTSLFGLAYVGPVGHFWYEGLDRAVRMRTNLPPDSIKFILTKVAMDGLIFGPVDLLIFFTYMGFSAGKTAAHVKEDIKKDFIPALLLEGCIWPIFQVANFRYIPVQHQLLYVNFLCLLDSCFLSWIEQQEDEDWKQWFSPLVSVEEERGGGQTR